MRNLDVGYNYRLQFFWIPTTDRGCQKPQQWYGYSTSLDIKTICDVDSRCRILVGILHQGRADPKICRGHVAVRPCLRANVLAMNAPKKTHHFEDKPPQKKMFLKVNVSFNCVFSEQIERYFLIGPLCCWICNFYTCQIVRNKRTSKITVFQNTTNQT
jgi:hypothetical protein